jgi:hypothetical protein
MVFDRTRQLSGGVPGGVAKGNGGMHPVVPKRTTRRPVAPSDKPVRQASVPEPTVTALVRQGVECAGGIYTSPPLAEDESSVEDFNRRVEDFQRRGGKSFEFHGVIVGENHKRPMMIYRREIPELGLMVDTRAVTGLRKYEMAIEVSAHYQENYNLVVRHNNVYTTADFIERHGADEVADTRSRNEMFVLEIDNLHSRGTIDVHAAVRTLHNLVADLLEAGANLINVARMVEAYKRTLRQDKDQRIIFVQCFVNDPRYEQLKAVIARHFPGIDFDNLPRLPGDVAGFLP